MTDNKPRFVEITSPDKKRTLVAIDEILTIEQNETASNTIITLKNSAKIIDRRMYIQFIEVLDKIKDIID